VHLKGGKTGMRDQKYENMTRREFLEKATVGSALLVSQAMGFSSRAHAAPYQLPPLPYSQNALQPYISSKTLGFHHGKHHKGYVEKFNELIKGTPMADQTLEQVIKDAFHPTEKTPLFNNAAQIWNHSFFWKSMRPKGGGKPKGKIKEKLDATFGNVEKFKEEFVKQAVSLFGSGWAWLAIEGDKLKIVQTKDADTPLVHGATPLLTPLLTIDVWEHSYYLDYQNRRKDYVTAVLDHLINWEFAEENLAKI